MVRCGLGQVIAQEESDGNGIAAPFGNAPLTAYVFEEPNHQHFEIDRRINSRAATTAIRIRRRTELTNLIEKPKRSQRLFQFRVERSCRGLNEPSRDNKEFGLRQGFQLKHIQTLSYLLNKPIQFR